MEFFYISLIFLFFTCIFAILYYNNTLIKSRVNDIENLLIETLINSLIFYENILIIDNKGYFRHDDEVGNNFKLIKENIQEYLYKIQDLDVDIDNNEFIQEKLINIRYLEKEITLIQKEEMLYAASIRARNKNNSGKIYFKN